jgi:phosphatidylglycerophosphate synthase
MASIYDLKPRFQALLRPLVRALAGGGVTANQVTVGAALLSMATGVAIARWPGSQRLLLLVPLVLFLRMALNAIDGMLAREHDQTSRLGAVLNELGDVVSDAALYLPLALVPGLDPRLIVVAVVIAVVAEMTGVVAIQVGATRRYDGPMGKSDRAFWFGLLTLLLGLGVAPGRWCSALAGLIVLLGLVTILNRARRALEAGA